MPATHIPGIGDEPSWLHEREVSPTTRGECGYGNMQRRDGAAERRLPLLLNQFENALEKISWLGNQTASCVRGCHCGKAPLFRWVWRYLFRRML